MTTQATDADTLHRLERLRRLQELLLQGHPGRPRWEPIDHQLPPPGNWYVFLLLGGRGAGKTFAAARYVDQHIHGPPCLPGPVPHRVAVIAPTLGDAVDACVTGPSGLRAHDPDARLVQATGGTYVRWPNGSEAKLFGASNPEDVERLRAGGNRCLAYAEELAAWRHLDDCWTHLRFGLRVGPDPRIVASTTPKPRALIKQLLTDPDVAVKRATTADNPHLPAHVRQALYDTYGGRQIGRQELAGELLDESEEALWRRSWLDRGRVRAAPDLTRVTVGVDPSGGAGEQGIVVVGRGVDGHGYVLADRSCKLSPEGWGRRVVQAWLDWQGDDVCIEQNFGGAMAVAVVRGAAVRMAAEGRPTGSLPIRTLVASRGKRVRAEPVSALAEVDPPRWHHVGTFPELEDQLCTWSPEAGYSPDRLDSMVWCAWHLRLVGTTGTTGRIGGLATAQTRIWNPA
jgi:phage terminase large subunit-like protein